jgi:serine phosphatase RsbU (regulator of sigma subunit)
MQVLARQCAQALERARLYAREHQIANRLQHALLPTAFPAIPGLIIDATYKTGAGEADISGDWYDAFVLPGDRLVLSIGDVAGRGLDAAVLMGEIRHAIRAAALAGHDLAKVLQVANSVVRTGPNRMVTAAVVMIDAMTLQCTYANAGHPAPMLATREGIEILEESTFPLGVRDGLPAVTESLRLPSEALLTIFTDGLTEFDRDAVAGEAALQRAVKDQFARLETRPTQAIVNQVLSGRSARDDIAILTVFVKPGIDR